MKRYFPIFLFAFAHLAAKDPGASLEESLEMRRIAEYWKEKDYQAVKVQVNDFLAKNPQSAYKDQLYRMLGDVYFQEKNFADAAAAYERIEGKAFRQKSRFQLLHSLYETGKYEDFILSADLFLKDPNSRPHDIETARFELAESCYIAGCAPENEARKQELLKRALSEYQQLAHTKYSTHVQLPLAQLYAFFDEHQKAAAQYQLLAQRDAAKKEEYLFQAASMQLQFDKKAAAETFGALAELNGKHASKAAFNELILLFQEKRYRDYILAQEKVAALVPAEKQPLIYYYLGKSLIHTKDFERAIPPLVKAIDSKTLDRSQEKSALLALAACAKETQDLHLFEKALPQLQSEFGKDAETESILLMHAQLCRDKKEWGKARQAIEQLLEASPDQPQRDALLYDYALCFLQEEKWGEGADAFEAFLTEYPQTAYRENGVRHFIACCAEDAKHASLETEGIKKERLLNALIGALEERKYFSDAERQKMRFLLGKTECDLGLYDEAIGELSEYVKDYAKSPASADAYLLLAQAYQKGSHDDVHFALSAEKALALNPALPGALDLRLSLFNTYLGLVEKASEEQEKHELMDKAAGHLFLALDKPVSKANQRWLAGYYFQQYQLGKRDAVERTVLILEKLLGIEEKEIKLSISSHSLDMEAEAIKLADLYGKTGRLLERSSLLEALVKEQRAHPDYHWKYQRMAEFELGKSYLATGGREKALQSFEELINSSTHASSYFALAAQLEKAKLEYSLLKASDRREDSKTALAVLDELKEIEIKRRLHSEPLHLEAALSYVDFKAELAPSDKRNSRKMFLLGQMKDSFSNEEDPLVEQYLSAGEQFPDKEQLFEQYLAYVDAEMLRLEAEEKNDAALARQAREQLASLAAEASDERLLERIEKSKEAK